MENDKEIVISIIELFKKALEDITTVITFYKQYENYENVAVLTYKGEYISIYNIYEPDYYFKLNPKWITKFDNIYQDVCYYNKMNGYIDIGKPVYNEKLKYDYERINNLINKKNNSFYRFFYGQPWIEDEYKRPRFFIKYNQLFFEINSNTYNLLFNLTTNVEKQMSIRRINQLLDTKINSYKDIINNIEPEILEENKNKQMDDIDILDNILEKISKFGIKSLTKVEKKFLKKNKNNK